MSGSISYPVVELAKVLRLMLASSQERVLDEFGLQSSCHFLLYDVFNYGNAETVAHHILKDGIPYFLNSNGLKLVKQPHGLEVLDDGKQYPFSARVFNCILVNHGLHVEPERVLPWPHLMGRYYVTKNDRSVYNFAGSTPIGTIQELDAFVQSNHGMLLEFGTTSIIGMDVSNARYLLHKLDERRKEFA